MTVGQSAPTMACDDRRLQPGRRCRLADDIPADRGRTLNCAAQLERCFLSQVRHYVQGIAQSDIWWPGDSPPPGCSGMFGRRLSLMQLPGPGAGAVPARSSLTALEVVSHAMHNASRHGVPAAPASIANASANSRAASSAHSVDSPAVEAIAFRRSAAPARESCASSRACR